MKLFIGNFEFEHSLAVPIGTTFPEKVRRINAELAPLLVIAAADGDCVELPEPVDPDFASRLVSVGFPSVTIISPPQPEEEDEDLEAMILETIVEQNIGWSPAFRTPRILPNTRGADLVPWGWTPGLRNLAKKCGWRCDAPEHAAVLAVNNRRYSFELEAEWQCGIEGEYSIRTLNDLEIAKERLPAGTAGWVVKAEFGMSARERVVGRCGDPSHQARNWIERRIGAGTKLFFEPWVDRIEEVGLQFTIPESGPPVLDGITPLLCDAQGQYRGSRFAEDPKLLSRWAEAVEIGLKAAARAQTFGYFGPMGIDAMRYRDAAGCERIRPLQDINGRMTMGRVSLGLRRLLAPGEVGSWLHLRCPAKNKDEAARWYDELFETIPAGIRKIRTSPLTVDGKAVQHATIAIISDDAEKLHAAEQQLLNL